MILDIFWLTYFAQQDNVLFLQNLGCQCTQRIFEGVLVRKDVRKSQEGNGDCQQHHRNYLWHSSCFLVRIHTGKLSFLFCHNINSFISKEPCSYISGRCECFLFCQSHFSSLGAYNRNLNLLLLLYIYYENDESLM